MKSVFGDSFYFIALLNARDFFHRDAVQLTRELGAEIVTTRWVITEVGNALSGLAARGSFGRFVHGLRFQSRVVVLTDTDALWVGRGLRSAPRTNTANRQMRPYRLRVGDFRIIYEFDLLRNELSLVTLGHRSDVHRHG